MYILARQTMLSFRMRYLIALTLLLSFLSLNAQMTPFLVFNFNQFTVTIQALSEVSPSSGDGLITKISDADGFNIQSRVMTDTGDFRTILTRNYPPSGSNYSNGIQITATTADFENIELSWIQCTSVLSANRLRVRYTINGEDWIDFNASESNAQNYCIVHEQDDGFDNGLFKTPHGSQYLATSSSVFPHYRKVDFSGIADVNDNPLFAVQFVTAYPSGSNVYEATESGNEYNIGAFIEYDDIIFKGEPLPLPVENISILRTVTPNTGARYKFTGFMIVTMVSNNRIYVQDATAGILIIDTQNLITDPYAIGDILTNFIGVVEVVDGMWSFIPKTVPLRTDVGAPLTPVSVTIPALQQNVEDYQARLVKISNVYFATTGDFENSASYQLIDENSASFTFKTIFPDVDYIQTAIPTIYQNIAGIISTDASGHFITARSDTDFSDMLMPPRNLAAVIDGHNVALQWTAPATPQREMLGYNVYKQSNLLNETPIDSLSFEDIVSDFGVYNYQVTAIYTGDVESTPSNTETVFIARLNPPVNFTGEQIEESVYLSWSAPQQESHMGTFQYFQIYKDENALALGEYTSTSYTDDAVEIGATYTYHITAIYTQGESEPSDTATITLIAEATYPPPTNLTATVERLTVSLQWVSPENPDTTVSGYNVYRNDILITPNPILPLLFSDTVPEYGNFSYYVTAVYTDNESVPSIRVDVFVARLNPPRELSGERVDEHVSLSWFIPLVESHMGDFQYYKIYRNDILISSGIVTNTFYSDHDVLASNSYTYFVTTKYVEGESEPSNTITINPLSDDDESTIPTTTNLIGNYPNPFNPETQIVFSLSKESHVEVTIYNLKGQKIKSLINAVKTRGNHRLLWNGTDDNGYPVSSGVYLYRLKTDDYISLRKMILIK